MDNRFIIPFPQMGTIREAAAVSGLAVYRIRRLVACNRIRYIRAGNRTLVNLDSLAHYLQTGDTQIPAEHAGMRRIPE